jgi:hypothetical protein
MDRTSASPVRMRICGTASDVMAFPGDDARTDVWLVTEARPRPFGVPQAYVFTCRGPAVNGYRSTIKALEACTIDASDEKHGRDEFFNMTAEGNLSRGLGRYIATHLRHRAPKPSASPPCRTLARGHPKTQAHIHFRNNPIPWFSSASNNSIRMRRVYWRLAAQQ